MNYQPKIADAPIFVKQRKWKYFKMNYKTT